MSVSSITERRRKRRLQERHAALDAQRLRLRHQHWALRLRRLSVERACRAYTFRCRLVEKQGRELRLQRQAFEVAEVDRQIAELQAKRERLAARMRQPIILRMRIGEHGITTVKASSEREP
jgi:hypothetical protein